MAKEIAFKIVADANQAASEAKTLKQQLREATKEAQNLIAAGQENTEAYRKARNEVAQLQDKLRDFNDELKALDPGAKFQAIAGIATGIAGGFQAAQGAMALFGKESEDVQKALLKVQSAMALAQGIDQVRELGKSFGLAKTAILGGVEGLGRMKTALIATGVGAFALAIGAIASNWEKVKEWIDKTIPSLGGVANLFDNIKKVGMGTLNSIIEGFKVFGEVVGNVFTGEFSKAAETAGEFGARVSKAYTEGYKEEEKKQAEDREATLLESQTKAHERQLKLLEAQGKDTYALKKKMLEEELRLLEIQQGKEVDAYKDKYIELQLLEIEHNNKLAEIQKQKEQKDTDAWFNRYNQQVAQSQFEKQISIDKANLEKQDQEASIANITAYGQKKIQIATFDAEAQKKITQQRAEAEFNAEMQLANAKISIAESSLNAISSLGSLIIKDQQKLEKFNKTAALIQIGIDTAKAISAAVAASSANPANATTFGAAGIAQFAATAAQIFANIAKAKQILSSGGNNAAPTLSTASVAPISGGGFSSPSAPSLGGGQTTVGGVGVTNQQGQGATSGGQFKIFVTETDISDTQHRVGTIKQKAKVF